MVPLGTKRIVVPPPPQKKGGVFFFFAPPSGILAGAAVFWGFAQKIFLKLVFICASGHSPNGPYG